MILIIDDDAAVRSSLTFLLKRAGFRPEAVPGPKEALEVVRATAPELILMDMNFTLTTTGEEGIQLLRQVKIFRPDVPVILMTAWGSISLAVQGMQGIIKIDPDRLGTERAEEGGKRSLEQFGCRS